MAYGITLGIGASGDVPTYIIVGLETAFVQAANFEDLTTIFIPYVDDLVDVALLASPDALVEIRDDRPTQQALVTYTDSNTMYAAALS